MMWKTIAQRNQEKKDANYAKGWHTVFAWWPVEVSNGRLVWLEEVALKYGYTEYCGVTQTYRTVTKRYVALAQMNCLWEDTND